ncbi:MAG: hypothetical protein J6T80_06245 [Paludibacteraceae bacterium]|nr:hypothetical protein [Paludibacteraceae bacterium]
MIVCLLFVDSHIYAYDESLPSASWGYKPLYTTSQSKPNVRGYGSVVGSKLSGDNYPTYRFRSTSPYSSKVNNTSFGIPLPQGPYKSSSWNWDEPDDDPIGVVPDPAPIGEPAILIVLAAIYLIWLQSKGRRKLQ